VWRLVLDANGASGWMGNVNWIRVIAPSSSPASGTILRGPYLQQVTDASAIVVWTTRQPGAGSVRYAETAGTPRTTAAESHVFPAAQTGLGFDFYQHEVRLSGLSASTPYSYDVLMSGQDATPGQDVFTTAPASGTGTVRFIAFGDSGNGSAAQTQLASRMDSQPFDFAIHSGDVAYGASNTTGPASYRQYDDWFFDIYRRWLRSHPAFATIGNHDEEIGSARAYRDVFVLPENGATPTYPDHAERYYSFDYGPVHVVVLDTELAFTDPARRQAQLAWLEADLSSTTQPWRIVAVHKPPFSASAGHGSALAVREAFSPVFERHGVQLVISGDDHNYERSVPLRQYTADGSAVTYVVTGGGGAALYPSGSSYWTAASASVHHYLYVSVGSCSLEVTARGVDGNVVETFGIDRCEMARDSRPPDVTITGPSSGATVSGTIQVQASAADDTHVVKVDIYVDGVQKGFGLSAPYSFNLDTTTLVNGAHVLEARVYDAAGRTSQSTLPITVANNSGPSSGDVVLYPSDVSVIQGNWSRLTSTTGAGGLKMTSEDRGFSQTAGALAAPADYFEASFNALAGDYRIWLRLRGAGDSKLNESVWVQLSDATSASGVPQWRIGTDSALLVNLENCADCGVSGWGWQDNAWWLGESSVVRFTASGPHTIRIQTREDGVDVDQIVLSPSTFFGSPPGALRDDQRIVPKSAP
jgi:Big-like domain-containing protein/calcineurin-like phosphoesterase family protein/purple acid phosphatase-like protein